MATFLDDIKATVGKSLKELDPQQVHARNEVFKKTARRYRRILKVAVPATLALVLLAIWTDAHAELALTAVVVGCVAAYACFNLGMALLSVDVYGRELKARILDIRKWCIAAGMSGTDLNTALVAWAKEPDGADGRRVQRVIEANR